MTKRHLPLARAASAFTAGLVLCGVVTVATSTTTAVAAEGADWSVVPVAGGYQVTLELSEPLPVVDDAPVLTADGVVLGPATESADGLSLSVVTADDAVAQADDVAFSWSSGDAPKAEPADSPATATAERVDPVTKPTTRQLKAALADGSAVGTFQYRQDDYDYGDQAIDLAGIGGIRGELTGRIYLPVGGGARPTVILLHGRHTSCGTVVTGTTNPGRWPCVAGQTDIPSYKGYDGTAQTLATQGYAVVSISANAINANDAQLATDDNGAVARGQLVVDSLAMIKKWNAGQPAVYHDDAKGTDRGTDDALDVPSAETGATYANQADLNQLDAATLVGRFDLDDVGLMGHSRGGEGVTSAVTLNQALPQPFGIKSVLPLAPVDFSRMTVSHTPMLVVLPYCDGDVSNQQGQHFIDDSRYNHGDDVMSSTVWVMGADHNFFNTSWTPGKYPYSTSDDWSATTDETCGASGAKSIRLSADAQYDVGTELMSAWFRLTLGEETSFLPMFDGTTKPTLSKTPSADLRTIGMAPRSQRAVVEPFTGSVDNVRTNGSSTAAPCASSPGRTLPQVLPACAAITTQRSTSSFPHWTPANYAPNVPASPMMRLLWTAAGTPSTAPETAGQVIGGGVARVTVPTAQRDASSYTTMSFKTAPDESVITGTDLYVTVVDGAGKAWTGLASAYNPLAVSRMPISTSLRNTGTTANPVLTPENRLNKIVLQQVSVPVATLAAAGINTSDLREVRFTGAVGADGTQTGGVYLSDLALTRSAVGTPQVLSSAATINVDPTSVEEGAGVDTRSVAVYLSKPLTTTASGWVSVNGSTATTSKAGLAAKLVTFAPGETCKAVTFTTLGDSTPGTTATTRYVAEVSNQSGVVYGIGAADFLTVREDDGLSATAPAGTVVAPAVGTQGDVCAELAAKGTVSALSTTSATPTPGAPVALRATGYRPGESVSFLETSARPVAPVATVLAGADGVAETILAGTTTVGPRTITATGAGSGRVQTVTLTVQTPGTTSTTPPTTPPTTTPTTSPVGTSPVVTKVASSVDVVSVKKVRGGKVQVKAEVTGAPGAPAPTGMVKIKLGTTKKSVVVPTSGVVKVRLADRGSRVVATYLGDAVHEGSKTRTRR